MRRRALCALLGVALIGAGGADPLARPVTLRTPAPVPAPNLPHVPEVGTGYAVPAGAAPPAEIAGVNAAPAVALALDDAIAMALLKNTNLALAQANRRIAAFQIVAARGAYDVKLQVVPSYTHAVDAPVNPLVTGPAFGSYTQDTTGLLAQVSAQTYGGTRLSAALSAQRTTTNEVGSGFSTSYPALLQVGLTQPLLRGSRSDDARRALALAVIGERSQTDATLLQASQTVAEVADAYWDLVANWRNVAIQETALQQAYAQAQSNVRLVRAGRAAAVDVAEANVQVQAYQDAVYSALENVARLQNTLKGLLLADAGDPLWRANLAPVTNPGEAPDEPPIDDAVAAAIRNRAEFAQLRDARRQAEVNVAYARDARRPQADFQLSLTSNAIAGIPNIDAANPIAAALGTQFAALNALIANANRTLPPGQQIPPLTGSARNVLQPPSALTGNVGTAFSQLAKTQYPVIAAQLVFGLPLRNRAADGNFAAARAQLASLDVQEIALLEQFRAEASNAVQVLRETRYRLGASRAAREAAQTVYESEGRTFARGSSTTFLVLQRLVDLATNQGRELQAQSDYNKAVVELERVTGTIFARNGIAVERAGTGVAAGR